MTGRRFPILWALPLLLHCGDALAWGLHTHVYLAQLLVWTIPLADRGFRRTLEKLPHLILAGACLPDLALVGRSAGTTAFDETHRWSCARRVLDAARCDEERAIALGFASHLLADIIAHHHFVLVHEKLWLDVPIVTHALSEWAMDGHLGRRAPAAPGELLRADASLLSAYAAHHFACRPAQARRALHLLARADSALRFARVPQACYWVARFGDPAIEERFEYYLEEIEARLVQINRILAGEEPSFQAEPAAREESRRWTASLPRHQIRHRAPLPRDLFKTPA